MSAIRNGLGFDAHRFAGGGDPRPLYLATLVWEGSGIKGDSDGDVAVHALIDALLAAAHLGDIGTLFGVGPASQGAGMHGADMLERTVRHLGEHGCTPMSASIAIIGNRPKIGQRRREAEDALSAICGCQVSLTATTTDGMGFTGHGEGIAAMATALVEVTGCDGCHDGTTA